jgi:hypothetical protein
MACTRCQAARTGALPPSVLRGLIPANAPTLQLSGDKIHSHSENADDEPTSKIKAQAVLLTDARDSSIDRGEILRRLKSLEHELGSVEHLNLERLDVSILDRRPALA